MTDSERAASEAREERAALALQRGLTWAWLAKEIAGGRLPAGTTPDDLEAP